MPTASPRHRSRSPSPSPTRRPNSHRGWRGSHVNVAMATIPKAEGFLVREWALPTSEVAIEEGEDGVLGRGSYGEVRIATWRGVRVAAKQLHALSEAQATESLSAEQAAEVQRDLLNEMGLLASLRHPNLLLFLGVTYDPETHGPRSIITELIPSSIYDLLETRGVILEQHEVLDVASDIASGLAYIHGQSPAIVHRDLSSRNVLYDGRTAKLADLGQAKAMGTASAAMGSRQTAMPGAMVYAAPEVLTGRYSSSIDVFSFGVLLAQLIMGEYPRLDRRKEQVTGAGNRFPLAKPLLESCLNLHAENRPAAAEALRSLENLRADPCAYHPAGHGAGILADRWFRAEQKEKCRELEARLRVHERRLAAEVGRWKEEADRADEMSGRIGAAESGRDAAIKRQRELEESLAGVFAALEEERSTRQIREGELEQAKGQARSLEGMVDRLQKELLRAERAVKSAETLQGLAEGNSALATRAASDAKEARIKAGQRAEQAEAQLAGQAAATREAEARLRQALSRWEGEKIDRLKYRKEYMAKCNEAQERERTVRDLRASLKEATDRLSTYDGLPESQKIRQRMLDLEDDRQRAKDEIAEREQELEERRRDIESLTDKLKTVEDERNAARQHCKTLEEATESARRDRKEAVQKAERARKATDKALRQAEEDKLQTEQLKDDIAGVRKEMKRVRKAAPWVFKGGSVDRNNSPHATGVDAGNENPTSARQLPPGGSGNAGEISGLGRGGDAASGAQDRPGSAFSACSSSSSDDGGGGNHAEAMVNKAKERGPRGVAELLRQHPKKNGVQRSGLRALRDLAYKGDEERAQVAAAGGVRAVVHAMKRFPADSRIQIIGVKTLAHLAFGNDVNRIEAGSFGGTAAILRAMAANPSDPEMQGEACTAVTNLSHNCDRNRRVIVEGGGLVLILNAMQNFPGHPKLQRQACWALLTLAANDDISRMIASEGGVGAIIAAMINNSDDTSVQHFGCWALANVGWGQADVQKFAREEGAIEAIKTAVERFPDHQALIAKARLASKVILSGTGQAPL